MNVHLNQPALQWHERNDFLDISLELQFPPLLLHELPHFLPEHLRGDAGPVAVFQHELPKQVFPDIRYQDEHHVGCADRFGVVIVCFQCNVMYV